MPRAPLLPPLRLTAPLWLYLGCLLIGTMYPFESEPGPITSRLPEFVQSLHRSPSPFLTQDFLANILAFIPFGIIVRLHFSTAQRRKLWSLLITVLLACLLSSMIEFTQLFVRNRHSSVTDIISNTIGGLAGVLIVQFWPRSYGRHLASLIRLDAAWHFTLAMSLILAWLPALIPVVFPNWQEPGLWATDVALTAGNNRSLTRPWWGRLHRLAIYGRALSPDEAREGFLRMMNKGKPVERNPNDQAIALYEFDESESTALLDRTGRGADLHLEGKGQLRWRPNHGGVYLRHPSRLSTTLSSGKQISSALLDERQFSLELWVTPRNLFQRGPAFILSLAGRADNTNLLLGQSTRDLVFWVRTPISGPSLTALSATTTNQPLTPHLTHVVAVFRDGRLELFVNGAKSGNLDLKHEAMIGLPARRTQGARVAYAFLYFFPFTLFWSSLLARKSRYAWLGWLAAVIFLFAGESIQAAKAERPFDLAFLLIGILMISLAFLVSRFSSPAPRSG